MVRYVMESEVEKLASRISVAADQAVKVVNQFCNTPLSQREINALWVWEAMEALLAIPDTYGRDENGKESIVRHKESSTSDNSKFPYVTIKNPTDRSVAPFNNTHFLVSGTSSLASLSTWAEFAQGTVEDAIDRHAAAGGMDSPPCGKVFRHD